MKILVPVGTRPEIVKLASVIHALAADHDVRVVATGQHHDRAMADSFFEDLDVRPASRWRLTGTEAERVGTLVTRAYEEVRDAEPDLVLVLGDTHTVPAFCLAARRHGVPVAHVEAGLRSFNETSMEEVNRRMAAAAASLHLAPTEVAARFLRAEGIAEGRIRVVGNPVTDALARSGVRRRAPEARRGIVMTAHRATNVDDPERLATIVDLAVDLHRGHGPVRLPLHPRTAARLAETGLGGRLTEAGVEVSEPLAYPDMLAAVANAAVVVTDSGGLQEEAAWFGVPVVVLRTTTPRWEGVEAGTTALCGLDADRVRAAVDRFSRPEEQARVAAVACPYGDGTTGTKIATLLEDPEVQQLLVIREPPLDDPGVVEQLGVLA